MRISDWSSDVCSSDLRDLVLPAVALRRICDLYAGDWDRADPELSPLYMDCDGMPPMLFVTTDNEMLLDDTLMLRSEEHTSELQSLMRISYAVFCLKKKKQNNDTKNIHTLNMIMMQSYNELKHSQQEQKTKTTQTTNKN